MPRSFQIQYNGQGQMETQSRKIMRSGTSGSVGSGPDPERLTSLDNPLGPFACGSTTSSKIVRNRLLDRNTVAFGD